MVPVRNLGLRKYKVGRKFLNKLCRCVYAGVEQIKQNWFYQLSIRDS